MEQKNRGYRLRVVIAIILTGITVFSLAIYDAIIKKVDIVVEGKEISVNTSKKTVSEVLEEKNISLGKSDDINIPVDSPLEDNMKIEIKRAIPVAINYGGNILEINTTKKTVKELLDSLKLDYKLDKVSPSLNDKIKSGTEINIVKVDEKIDTINEPIPYKTVTKNNIKIDKGKEITVQDGQEGIKEIKIKKVYENGKLLASEIIEEKVAKEPINKIVEKGTKEADYTIASRGTFAGKKEMYGYTIQLVGFCFMFYMGIASATSVRVAEAFGRGNKEEVVNAGRLGVAATILTGVTLGLGLVIFSGPLSVLLVKHDAVIDGVRIAPAIASLLFLASVMTVFDGIQATASFALRAQEIVWSPSLIHIGSFFLVMLPACYWLGIVQGHGAKGMMEGALIGVFVAGTLQTLMLELKAARPLKGHAA